MPIPLFATIGGAALAGGALLGSINRTIDKITGNIRSLLQEVGQMVENTINNIRETYKDMLDVTIESLDGLVQSIFIELRNTFAEIAQAIEEIIDGVFDNVEELLNSVKIKLTQTIIEIEKSVNNVLYVFFEGVAFAIDKAIYKIFALVGWIFFGVGLIIFTVMLAKRGIPEGLAGTLVVVFMLLFVVTFGALGLIPKFRLWAVKFTGIGLKARLKTAVEQPRIIAINPEVIEIDDTEELTILGFALLPKDTSPQVTINNQPFPIKASSQEALVIDVSNLNLPNGSTNLRVNYPNSDFEELSEIVSIYKEEETNISFQSLSIAGGKLGEITKASFFVRNAPNMGEAEDFKVEWNTNDRGQVYRRVIDKLNPGEREKVEFTHIFQKSGDYNTIFKLDPDGKVKETNTSDNILSRRVRVKPTHYRVTLKLLSFKLSGKLGTAPVTFSNEKTDFEIRLSGGETLRTSTSKQQDQQLNIQKTYAAIKMNAILQTRLKIKAKFSIFGPLSQSLSLSLALANITLSGDNDPEKIIELNPTRSASAKSGNVTISYQLRYNIVLKPI